MFALGGVPENYSNLNQSQWAILYNHLQDKKDKERKEMLDILEYIALLVSFNPKAAHKVINMRRKEMQMKENASKKNFKEVDESGLNPFGGVYNTTFFDQIKEIAGADAVKELKDDGSSEKENKDEFTYESYDEDDFMKEAKRLAEEEEIILAEEAQYRETHKDDNTDTIIF